MYKRQNNNRGLFKTTNGGKSWQKVLYINDSTGANDIVISPANPKIMYTSMWEMHPGIYGKNSGVYRSTAVSYTHLDVYKRQT